MDVTSVERSANPRNITLVSSVCKPGLDEGEGRVLTARPRVISDPDEQQERELPVRPRDINAQAAATAPSPAPSSQLLGPLGLALPAWKPEYTADKEKAELLVNQRAAEGGHVHGYGGGKTYWDAYYSDPSSFNEAYSREWYCSAESLRPHMRSKSQPSAQGLLALELGCGTSMVSAVLEDMGYAVMACDFSGEGGDYCFAAVQTHTAPWLSLSISGLLPRSLPSMHGQCSAHVATIALCVSSW